MTTSLRSISGRSSDRRAASSSGARTSGSRAGCSRTTIAAGLLENNPDQLARWLRHPNEVKPGTKMYYGIGGMAGYMKPDGKGGWEKNISLTEEDITALVAYLSSLK